MADSIVTDILMALLESPFTLTHHRHRPTALLIDFHVYQEETFKYSLILHFNYHQTNNEEEVLHSYPSLSCATTTSHDILGRFSSAGATFVATTTTTATTTTLSYNYLKHATQN